MTKSNFVTTEELKKQLEALEERLDEKLKMYLKIARLDTTIIVNQAVDKLTKVVATFTDKTITRFDPLLEELETRREDRIIATKDTYEIKQRLDNLENRTTKVEKLQHVS